jgi:hypothetical protein
MLSGLLRAIGGAIVGAAVSWLTRSVVMAGYRVLASGQNGPLAALPPPALAPSPSEHAAPDQLSAQDRAALVVWAAEHREECAGMLFTREERRRLRFEVYVRERRTLLWLVVAGMWLHRRSGGSR